MDSQLSLVALHELIAAHTAVVPVAGGAVAGLAISIFRRPISLFRPFGLRESESLMNFSSLGTLRCICGVEQMDGGADRRQFCRSCGCEVVAQNTAMLEKQLTGKEIRMMTRSLRNAAIRASHLELPPSITSIEELHRYLDSSEPKNDRTPPTRPTPVEHPQVH